MIFSSVTVFDGPEMGEMFPEIEFTVMNDAELTV
jgi:hypothetical protein